MTRNNIKKLYLNPEMADVKFIFGADTDHVETVAAHKSILSISSQQFRLMFYGPFRLEGDVPIVTASVAAFKEFLQFFYLDKVKLSSQHIVAVTNLCKKYELADALKLCEIPLQMSFTIDDMCSRYKLALLLEIPSTIQFCEQKIQSNADKILKSTSFLKCDREMVDKIIQLVTSEVNASERVFAYIAWAKAACGRKNLEETAENLKAQLGQSFERIPFDEMIMEKFEQFTTIYNDFLSEFEKTSIISKIMKKKNNEKYLLTDDSDDDTDDDDFFDDFDYFGQSSDDTIHENDDDDDDDLDVVPCFTSIFGHESDHYLPWFH